MASSSSSNMKGISFLWMIQLPTNSVGLAYPLHSSHLSLLLGHKSPLQNTGFIANKSRHRCTFSTNLCQRDEKCSSLFMTSSPENRDSILKEATTNGAYASNSERDSYSDESSKISMMSQLEVDDDIFLEDENDDADDELLPTTRIRSSEVLDDMWSMSLQSLQSPSTTANPNQPTSNIPKRTNPRMQMFAYLSQPIVEVRIVGLVLLSCFLVAVDTLENLPSEIRAGINVVDTLCVYFFAVEFFLRWWSAGRFQLRYLGRPLVAIDAVVVILPLILSGLLPIWDLGVMTGFFPGVSLPSWLIATSSSANSALLNLRLLRILKFQRVLTDEDTFTKFQMALGVRRKGVRPYQLQLARVILSVTALVSVSTGLIYTAEHDVNPAIPDYFTALYFGLTTLTTVGFGDITPVTFEGRLVVGGSILAGVAVIPSQAASLAEAYLDFQKERSAGKKRGITKANSNISLSESQKCSKCGAGYHRMDASFCWSCGEQLKR